MKNKKQSILSNNKKTLHAAVIRAAAVHKAFIRDNQIEFPMHPGQLNLNGMLFPVFEDVKS